MEGLFELWLVNEEGPLQKELDIELKLVSIIQIREIQI